MSDIVEKFNTLMVHIDEEKILDIPANCGHLQFKKQYSQIAMIKNNSELICTIDKEITEKNAAHPTFNCDLIIAAQLMFELSPRELKDQLTKIEDTDCHLTEYSINFKNDIPNDDDVLHFLTICSLYCSEESSRYIFTKLMYLYKNKMDSKIIIGEKTLKKGRRRKCFSVFQITCNEKGINIKLDCEFLNFNFTHDTKLHISMISKYNLHAKTILNFSFNFLKNAKKSKLKIQYPG